MVHGGLTQYQHDVAVLERRIHTVAAHAHSTEVLGFPAFEVGARHFDLLAGRALVDGYAVVVRRYAGDDRKCHCVLGDDGGGESWCGGFVPAHQYSRSNAENVSQFGNAFMP